MRNPSSDFIDSAVWSCMPRKMMSPSPGVVDLVVEDLEAATDAECCDLALRSAACSIAPACAAPRECRPQASRVRPGRSRPAVRRRNATCPNRAAVDALVAGRLQQRLEHLGGWDFQGGHDRSTRAARGVGNQEVRTSRSRRASQSFASPCGTDRPGKSKIGARTEAKVIGSPLTSPSRGSICGRPGWSDRRDSGAVAGVPPTILPSKNRVAIPDVPASGAGGCAVLGKEMPVRWFAGSR